MWAIIESLKLLRKSLKNLSLKKLLNFPSTQNPKKNHHPNNSPKSIQSSNPLSQTPWQISANQFLNNSNMNLYSREKVFCEQVLTEIESFDSLNLKEDLLTSLKSNNQKIKLVHKYALDSILSLKSLLIISPSGLGRGSSTMIGILNSIDQSNNYPQAIVLSPRKDLAKEYYSELNSIKSEMKITSSLLVADVRYEAASFTSQVIIGTCGTIYRLCKEKAINLNHLKIIVCDIAFKLFKDPCIQHTEQLLNLIHRPCTYWYLSPKDKHNIKEKFLARAGDFPIIHIKDDEKPIDNFKYYFVGVDSQEEKIEFIKGIVYHHNNQAIIYSHNREELENYEKDLKDYSCGLVIARFSKTHQSTILQDFQNETLKVLLCESKPSLLRKIRSQGKVDLIFTDSSKDPEHFMMRLRRCDYSANDEVYFVLLKSELTFLYPLIQHFKLEVFNY